MTRLTFGIATVLGGLLGWACSTSGDSGSALTDNRGGAPSIFASGGSQGTGTNTPTMGSGPSVVVTGTTKPPDNVTYRRPKMCDANGENCKCMNLASFGDRASAAYGTGSDGQPSSTTAFDTWLTEKSSANVTMVTTKPAITAEYLAGFDVIILQDLRKWSFTQAERDALATWVNEGGGLISLNGYMNNDDEEVTATNSVIGFTGMSYTGGSANGSVPGGTCPDAAAKQICPQSNSGCCYCWNNTIPILDWDVSHPVAKDIH
ncbi:MAG TPA: hypothetical protein VIV60_32990, partial [Polyangiaceae bacterium]